ncbi:MAG: DUF2624 family protein [Bacilli bacterium]|nr:DUF2624 family protein [Bacilli bacterium]
MYKSIIKNYIKKLNVEDVLNFSLKNNINLSEVEANIILNYIKQDYETIIYGDPKNIFNELKTKLDKENYIKIINIYYEFKEKYKNYL